MRSATGSRGNVSREVWHDHDLFDGRSVRHRGFVFCAVGQSVQRPTQEGIALCAHLLTLTQQLLIHFEQNGPLIKFFEYKTNIHRQ